MSSILSQKKTEAGGRRTEVAIRSQQSDLRYQFFLMLRHIVYPGEMCKEWGTSFNNQITGISVEDLQGYMNGQNKLYKDYKS